MLYLHLLIYLACKFASASHIQRPLIFCFFPFFYSAIDSATYSEGPVKPQRGSTLIEVLVSLLILSVSVLGFAGASLLGSDLIYVSHQQEEAIRVVTELSERIASNPEAMQEYVESLSGAQGVKPKHLKTSPCENNKAARTGESCTPKQRALGDIQALASKAASDFPSGRLGVSVCGVAAAIKQYCLVLAWGETRIDQCLERQSTENRTENTNTIQCVILPAMRGS